MGDIFPELAKGGANGTVRQKRPAKYRNPQNPDDTWSGIGRTPKWVAAIVEERGIDVPAFKAIPMYQIGLISRCSSGTAMVNLTGWREAGPQAGPHRRDTPNSTRNTLRSPLGAHLGPPGIGSIVRSASRSKCISPPELHETIGAIWSLQSPGSRKRAKRER